MFTRSRIALAAATAVAGVLLTAAPALAMPSALTQDTRPMISHSAYGYSLSQTSLAALEHSLPRTTPVAATPSAPVTPHMFLTAGRGAQPVTAGLPRTVGNGSGQAALALGFVLLLTLAAALLVARVVRIEPRRPISA